MKTVVIMFPKVTFVPINQPKTIDVQMAEKLPLYRVGVLANGHYVPVIVLLGISGYARDLILNTRRCVSNNIYLFYRLKKRKRIKRNFYNHNCISTF